MANDEKKAVVIDVYVGSETARQIRSSWGLSIEALAHRVGVSASTVSRWERGLAEPRGLQRKSDVRVLTKLADQAGLDA